MKPITKIFFSIYIFIMHVGNMQVSNEIMHVSSKTMHVSSRRVVVKLSTGIYIILYARKYSNNS